MNRPRPRVIGGWPVQPIGGWPPDWTEADKAEWEKRVIHHEVREWETVVIPHGRPDPRKWHGALVAARVRVVCRICGGTVATLEEYEGGLLWHQNGERRAGARLSCPRHGALRLERDRLQDSLEQARERGTKVTLRAGPRDAC